MSYQLIQEALNKIGQISTWETLLVKYNHTSYPNQFTCYNINFAQDSILLNTLSDMKGTFLKIIDRYDKKVEMYSGYNPKNVVEKLALDNPIINDAWDSLIQHINCSDDSTEIKNIKANAYIFIGTYSEASSTKNIYIIARKNPVLSFKKGRAPIFTSRHNVLDKADDPLLQFGKCFDALVYNNAIYMINSNCESIFNMEYSHKKICQKSLDALEASSIIEDMSAYRQFATTGQTPKKFISYDETIVEKLKEPRWRRKVIQELKIPFNNTTKKFILNEEQHARIFTLAICGKTKLNMFDEGICEVPTSTPLNLS